MTAFAAREAAQAALLTRKRHEPDEDGFVTVTRGGRNGPARQEVAQTQAENHKARRKGLEDFYRFQTREKRKAQAGELRRKFEEDRETVRKMRENRGNSRVNADLLHLRIEKLIKFQAGVKHQSPLGCFSYNAHSWHSERSLCLHKPTTVANSDRLVVTNLEQKKFKESGSVEDAQFSTLLFLAWYT